MASPSLTIEWEFTSPDPVIVQAEYRVKVVRTDTNDTIFDTGYISDPSTTSYTLTGLLSDVEQEVQVIVTDSSANVSNTATRLVTPSFSAPDAPTFTAEADEDNGTIIVTVSNPTPTGDLPAAGRNDIYRAIADSGSFIKVGECEPDGVFVDYGAGAGVEYDYRVLAVAEGSTGSSVVTVALEFQGLFIHDPTDASGTSRQYLYGRANKKDSITTPATAQRFVGRSYPVYEFGEAFEE